MALISQRVEDIFGGVSQSAQLAENEFREQTNALPVFAEKRLKRRPPLIHKAKLTTETATSAFEMKLGDYTVLIVNGIVKVLETLTGTLQDVIVRSGSSYVATAGSLRGVAVGDTAIICNQDVVVAKGTTTAPVGTIEAYVYIRQGDYSTNYNVSINGMVSNYSVPDNTGAAAKQYTATDIIAGNLANAIIANATLESLFTIELFGSSIRITSKTGDDFTVSGFSGLGNDGLIVIKGSVQQFSDLPPVAKAGSIVEVTGSEATKFDNYFVQFVGTDQLGTWKEVAKPGSVSELDASTMPVRIVKNGDYVKKEAAYKLPVSAEQLFDVTSTLVVIPNKTAASTKMVDVLYPIHSLWLLAIYDDASPDTIEAVFTHTVTAETETADDIAVALQAAIDADANYTATVAGNIITIDRTVPTTPPIITANTGWDSQHYVWSPDLNMVTDEHVGRTLVNLTKGTSAPITANSTKVIEMLASTFHTDPGDIFAIRGTGTYFILEECPWEERIVGDDLTAPFPSFAEKAIADVFVHQGRLSFVFGANVSCSRAGDLYNFFRQTATEVLASDPIDVSGSSSGVTEFHSAIEWNDRPYLWTDEAQFRFGADGILTPETVSLTKASAYRNSGAVRPAVAGSRVFFASVRSGFAHVHEYMIAGQAQQHVALDLTLKIPQYIAGNPVALIADDSQGIVILASDTGNLFAYCYSYEAEERAQTAWGMWTFGSGVTQALNIVNGVMVLIMAYGDGTYLNVMPFDPATLLLYENFETFDGNWDFNNPGGYDGGPDAVTLEALAAYLDRHISSLDTTVVYDGVNTTWTLPYSVALSGEEGEVVVTLGNPADELTVTRPASTKVSAIGDYSGSDVNIGIRYQTAFTLPVLQYRDPKGTADPRGRLQVRFVRFLFENLVRIAAVVSILGRADRTYVAASSEITAGEFVVPVQSQSDNATIRIECESAGAESFTSYAWEGTLHERTRLL